LIAIATEPRCSWVHDRGKLWSRGNKLCADGRHNGAYCTCSFIEGWGRRTRLLGPGRWGGGRGCIGSRSRRSRKGRRLGRS